MNQPKDRAARHWVVGTLGHLQTQKRVVAQLRKLPIRHEMKVAKIRGDPNWVRTIGLQRNGGRIMELEGGHTDEFRYEINKAEIKCFYLGQVLQSNHRRNSFFGQYCSVPCRSVCFSVETVPVLPRFVCCSAWTGPVIFDKIWPEQTERNEFHRYSTGTILFFTDLF